METVKTTREGRGRRDTVVLAPAPSLLGHVRCKADTVGVVVGDVSGTAPIERLDVDEEVGTRNLVVDHHGVRSVVEGRATRLVPGEERAVAPLATLGKHTSRPKDTPKTGEFKTATRAW